MAGRLPIIQAKLEAFMSSIGGGTPQTRISLIKVEEFNKILADIRASFPDYKNDLPSPLKGYSKFNALGQTDVFLPDLEYAVRLTVNVIRVIEDQK